MLSRETLERYGRMTPGERLALTFKLIEESEPYSVAEPYRSGWVDQVRGLNLVKLKR